MVMTINVTVLPTTKVHDFTAVENFSYSNQDKNIRELLGQVFTKYFPHNYYYYYKWQPHSW